MRKPDLRDIAAEIARRGEHQGNVVRLSDPPKPLERLQLLAARLERRPIAIMPHKCSMEEWMERYGRPMMRDRLRPSGST